MAVAELMYCDETGITNMLRTCPSMCLLRTRKRPSHHRCMLAASCTLDSCSFCFVPPNSRAKDTSCSQHVNILAIALDQHANMLVVASER